MRHLMSPLDLSKEELEDLLTLASDIEKNPKKYAHTFEGKLVVGFYLLDACRCTISEGGNLP